MNGSGVSVAKTVYRIGAKGDCLCSIVVRPNGDKFFFYALHLAHHAIDNARLAVGRRKDDAVAFGNADNPVLGLKLMILAKLATFATHGADFFIELAHVLICEGKYKPRFYRIGFAVSLPLLDKRGAGFLLVIFPMQATTLFEDIEGVLKLATRQHFGGGFVFGVPLPQDLR